MTRKPTTASVGSNNRILAVKELKDRQNRGLVPADDSVLSVADHGNVIVVYTEHTSFGVVKPKKEVSSGKSSSTG